MKIDSDIVYLSATTLNLNNITFESISAASADTSIIFGVLYSAVFVNNIRYSNSSWRFIYLDSSTLSISNLTANSVSLDNYLMNFLSCYSISVADSNIYSINSASSSVIYSSSSQFDQIRNVTLLDLNTTGVEFSKSNVTQISGMMLSSLPKGMIMKNTIISSFSSSQFVSWGSSKIAYGGAIDAIDSSIYLHNSTASRSIAQNGGAFSIRWNHYDLCDNKITGSNFESNAAEVKGGAIYYNFKRPLISNIKYANNSAPYGPNIASYSVKIIEQTSKNTSITFNNIPSGIKFGSNLDLILQDYDNQTIPDSSYQIKIYPITPNASVSGYDSARAVEGVASFSNLIFIFSPGSQHIQYKATSNAINAQSNIALGIPSYSTIDVSFRYWMPGEFQISKSECQTCAPGTYSFEWNSISWTNWISDTVCSGGAVVEVNLGYWRISTNSTTVLNCPYPSSWLGGYDSESKYPVKWETGYTGYLWAEWGIIDGVKYEKASGAMWNKWSDPVLNALKFIAIVIAAFAFLLIMIILVLRKRKENQISILIRILTNYLQLISLSMSFNLKIPSSLTQAFNVFDTIGSSSDTFLSYDWFFTSIKITGFTPSVQLFKILLTGLLPLILFAACSLIWVLLYYSMNKWFSNLKLNMVVSAICIIFLLHPTITKSALLVFEWIVVDANDKRMKLYMEYKWYSAEHFTWIAFVSLPTLIVWVIGAPCLAFMILYKYRHDLEGNIKFYMLMLYQGYKPNVFYWEFVNTVRKVLVLCWSVFLSTEATMYRILLSILVLIVMLRIQIRLAPYKFEINNFLEQEMIITGSITLFWGLIFINESSSVALFSTFALLVMLISNIYFVVLWLFYFLVSLNLKHRYFKKIIEIYSYAILQNKFLSNLKANENSVNTLAEKAPKKRKKRIHKKLLQGSIQIRFWFLNQNFTIFTDFLKALSL